MSQIAYISIFVLEGATFVSTNVSGKISYSIFNNRNTRCVQFWGMKVNHTSISLSALTNETGPLRMGSVEGIHARENLFGPVCVNDHLVLHHVAWPTVDVAVLESPLAEHSSHIKERDQSQT